MLKTRMKMFFVTLMTVFSLTFVPIARADLSTDLLQQIANNTLAMLTAFNNFALAWINPDKSDSTAAIQADLTTYMNDVLNNADTQLKLQPQLLNIYFGSQSKAPAYANDLTYTTLLGQPYFNETDKSKLQTSALNYTQYASALNIQHAIPQNGWSGTAQDKNNYSNFYKTISAVQTFNAYLLSNYYSNYTNGLQFTNTQAKLQSEASSPDWFTAVASENIGWVLRQNLMFTSQLYLLMSQLVQIQNQLLASSAMSNSLIILGNQFNEANLLNKALGKTPG